MTFSYFGKVLAKTRFLRDLYRDQCLCRYDHAHCCSMHNAISTFLKSIVTYRNSASLLEKNLRKLKIQWIFVDGVEGKSNIVDISMIFSFSLHPINKYSFQNKCSPIFFNQYIPFAIFSKHLSTYILNGIFSKRILRNNQIHKNLAVSEKRTEMTLLEKISSKSWVYF